MHEHLEIIMPPTDDVESAVAKILEPWSEQENERHGFYDYYVIGGRFSGNKLVQALDPKKLDEFYEWTKSEKITIRGVQCGKPELSHPDQIPKVDLKWNEMFPDPDGKKVACPLFKHSGNQYNHDLSDITRFDVSRKVSCDRVIIADRDIRSTLFMISRYAYNGTTLMKVTWKGTIGDAVHQFESKEVEPLPSNLPSNKWICVTVDCHH